MPHTTQVMPPRPIQEERGIHPRTNEPPAQDSDENSTKCCTPTGYPNDRPMVQVLVTAIRARGRFSSLLRRGNCSGFLLYNDCLSYAHGTVARRTYGAVLKLKISGGVDM